MLIEIIIGVTLSVILIFVVYCITILLVMASKKCNINKAIAIVSDFMKTIYRTLFEKPKKKMEYPSCIGWNGIAVKPEDINRRFEKLEKYWKIVYYFDTDYKHPNLYLYKFRISMPINKDFRKTRLIGLVQKIAEKALAEYMQEWNCYVPVDKFIAVTIRGDILYIAIAKNDAGFEEIAQLRKHY